jgi:5-methylcytosine-specific restriction endonuclease McrA
MSGSKCDQCRPKVSQVSYKKHYYANHKISEQCTCNQCGKLFDRYQRMFCVVCKDCLKSQNYERRKIKNRERQRRIVVAAKELIVREVILERDNWTCQICKEPVARDMQWPHPLCATLDHIVPVSKGGSHTYDNLQCAHNKCNQQKGDKLCHIDRDVYATDAVGLSVEGVSVNE